MSLAVSASSFASAAQASPLGRALASSRRPGPQALAWVLVAALAWGVAPFVGSEYAYSAILVPLLVFSLAGLGLNILTGLAGQLSVGSAAFMAIGAFATYNFALRLPGLPLLASLALGGLVAAVFGVVVGLPALRIRGFYLIVSTLAAQFFVQWVLVKFGWFSNYNASGVISAPRLVVAGLDFGSPAGRYVFCLGIVSVLTLLAHNLVHSATGRRWLAVRDTDIAAAVIGVDTARAKLLAFGVSSFYLGVAGALWAFAYVGTVEPHGFDLTRSFQILFIIIIGGLGSIAGSFLGAAFIVLFPIALSVGASRWLAGIIDPGNFDNAQKIVFGTLIIAFLIKEPEGLARLLGRGWQRMRSWPLQA